MRVSVPTGRHTDIYEVISYGLYLKFNGLDDFFGTLLILFLIWNLIIKQEKITFNEKIKVF
jgi:hypothetical protein